MPSPLVQAKPVRPASVFIPATISATSMVAMLSLAAFAAACIGHTAGSWALTGAVATFATAGAVAWLPTAIIATVLAIASFAALLLVLNAKTAPIVAPAKPPRRVRFEEDLKGPSCSARRPAETPSEAPGEFSQTAYEEALWLQQNGQAAETVVHSLPHREGVCTEVLMNALAAGGAFVDVIAVPGANSLKRKPNLLEAMALSKFLRTPTWENLLAFSDMCGKQGLDTWGLEPLLAYTHEDWKASCLRPGAWTARAEAILLKWEAISDHDSLLVADLALLIARRSEMEIFAFLELHESRIPPKALVVQTWSSIQKGKNAELPKFYLDGVRERLIKHFQP